jgi:hypothetical protein
MKGKTFAVDQAFGALDIMGGGCMLERFHLKAIVFVPLAGTNVQLAQTSFRIRSTCAQALLQTLS